jgi:uncharacterized membrane protein YdbT with pleckstrin-like domain
MGNYVRRNLTSGEQVVYETKLHWIIFVSLKAILTLFIAPLIAFLTSEFAITNKRVIIKVGLIRRRTLEMNLNKIESVKIDQGILARMLGYGTIVIIGTGGTKEPFAAISDPMTFRKKFEEPIPVPAPLQATGITPAKSVETPVPDKASKPARCKDCGREVALTAKACPHCGAKLRSNLAGNVWHFINKSI